MRFHLLGLAYVPQRAEISCCAFTHKILELANMLIMLGHEVYFYGSDDSDIICTEHIKVIDKLERIRVYGDYDWKKQFFPGEGGDEAHKIFNENAISEINKRKQDGDFLLCTMGHWQKPIADSVNLIEVEAGIGYEGIFARYKVFESYAWMHYLYGKTGIQQGQWYDAVIPSFFDVTKFPYHETKLDYHLFMGRIVDCKGINVAAQITKQLGKKLIVAGQGCLDDLNIPTKHIEFIGAVEPSERADLMGHAEAFWCPSYYLEPFGSVAVEAMLTGTPIITTDWGAFSETVEHGKTGFRCRTFEQFLYAAKCIKELEPSYCRLWASRNYSLQRVKLMYEEYFQSLRLMRESLQT